MAGLNVPPVHAVNQRSQGSMDMTNGAEERVKLGTAMDHMISVMQGQVLSLRHELFLSEKTRSRASTAYTESAIQDCLESL